MGVDPNIPRPRPPELSAGAEAGPPPAGAPASVTSLDEAFHRLGWRADVLPDSVLHECERAAQVDDQVLAECCSIVLALGRPLVRLHEVGIPEERSPLTMTADELDTYRAQTEALRKVRELAAELAPYEQAAYAEASGLLDDVHGARRRTDRESDHVAESRAAQAAADLLRVEAELVVAEERFSLLPDPQDLPDGTERVLAEHAWEHAQVMVEYWRTEAESARHLAPLLSSLAHDQRTVSEEITGLFDQGWRRLLVESADQRARRLRRERRRRLRRGLRVVGGLALSLAIATAVERVTESVATSAAVSLPVAVGLAVFERWFLAPWLERRRFAADAAALDAEVVASMAFWVSLRAKQAFINSYAAPDVEGVVLIPPPLRHRPTVHDTA